MDSREKKGRVGGETDTRARDVSEQREEGEGRARGWAVGPKQAGPREKKEEAFRPIFQGEVRVSYYFFLFFSLFQSHFQIRYKITLNYF